MNRTKKALVALISLTGLFLIGCDSGVSLIQDPVITFNNVEVANLGLSGLTLNVNVDVENPNAFPIPMPKIDWVLSINDTHFLNGTQEENRSIRGRETVTISFPVNITFENIFRTFSSLIGRREVAYDIDLDLRFPIPLLENKVFERKYSGVLPLRP
ncbi:MAG: LEA type 2 family protein [Treponema sp.]|nr:LEA type 2 family protein [Treponema sp.]